jgi:hypothetical protein
MISQSLNKSVNEVEQYVDEARQCMHSAHPPQQVRECIEQLHEAARRAKREASSVDDDARMQPVIFALEKEADRTLQACRAAGNVDPKLMSAVQRAHDEASHLKKQVQAGSPA